MQQRVKHRLSAHHKIKFQAFDTWSGFSLTETLRPGKYIQRADVQ